MALHVRAYNVLFGDCLLVTWDEADGEYNAWIDFGNFHNDRNAVFDVVYEDVLRRTNGLLDLVVITHRHMDHLEGFYSLRQRFARDFEIRKLWHAHVDPAVDHRFRLAAGRIKQLIPRRYLDGGNTLANIFRNNFGTAALTTEDRMRGILNTLRVADGGVHAVHRESDLAAIMPPGVSKLSIDILGPEPDSESYFEPLENGRGLRVRALRALDARRDPMLELMAGQGGMPAADAQLTRIASFARLRRQLLSARGLDLLAATDTTRNNTSIVLRIGYEGKHFLFTGDAEEKAWEIMQHNDAELSSHFVKVGHHGSINATPAWSYRGIMTRRRKSNSAIVSTDDTRFTGENEVPKAEVLDGWTERLSEPRRLLRTDRVAEGESVVIKY